MRDSKRWRPVAAAFRLGGEPAERAPLGRWDYWTDAWPTRAVAPGPGRSAALSTAAVKVGWMQKTVASFEVCGVLLRQVAGFAPFSMIVREGVVTVVKLVPNAPG